MRVAIDGPPVENCSDGFFPASQGTGATLQPVPGAYDGIYDHRPAWEIMRGFPCPVCGYMDLMGKNGNAYVHVTPYHGRPRICRFTGEDK